MSRYIQSTKGKVVYNKWQVGQMRKSLLFNVKKIISISLMLIVLMCAVTSVSGYDSDLDLDTNSLNSLLYSKSRFYTQGLQELSPEKIQQSISKFKDIEDHWCREYVGKLASLLIVEPDENGLYRPDDEISVYEFVVMILNA